MEQNIDNNIELKNKLISFFNSNKRKIYIFFSIILIAILIKSYFVIDSHKKNYLIAEKYIKAGLYLGANKKEQSQNLYNEIILSKNKFYSILALNTIIEKNLVSDKNKILNYFKIIERLNISEEKKDLLQFKKSLYFLKNSNTEEGNRLLQDLIKKNSNFKALAEQIVTK